MSNLLSKFRKREVDKNFAGEKFCLQVNNDDMLFFQTELDMKKYLNDYHQRIPIHKLVMFKVKFYKIV